jgi:hypothetical protein
MSYERKKELNKARDKTRGKYEKEMRKSDGRIVVLAQAYRFLVQMTGGGIP